MENLFIQPSRKTPKITLDAQSGQLEISGRSIPENAIEFFKPVYDWLEAYQAQHPAPTQTELNVKLEYFNTSSSKCLVEVFRRLEYLQEAGGAVTINWFYEEDDEDMQESGEDFQEITTLTINMHAQEEE